jgi:hypothetical protein
MRVLGPRPLAALLAVAVCAGVAAGSTSARRPDFVYAPDIGWWVHQSLEMATEYTGSETKKIPLPTYIRCYTSDTPFEAGLRRDGDSVSDAHLTIAYYVDGTSYVNVRASTCRQVRQFTGQDGRVKPVITEFTAGAMSTVLHESLHRQGFDNEKLTECYGNDTTRYAGWLSWWQQTPDDSDASWAESERWGNWAMKLAFQYSHHEVDESYEMPTSSCLALVKRLSWADRVS